METNNKDLVFLTNSMKSLSLETIKSSFEKNILEKKKSLGEKVLTQRDFIENGMINAYFSLMSGSLRKLGIEEFARMYGLEYNSGGKYNSKERIDVYYEKEIKDKYVKNNILLTQKGLIKAGHNGWVQAITRGLYGYETFNDFKASKGLKISDKIIDPHEVDEYVRKNILPICRGGKFISQTGLKQNFGQFFKQVLEGKYKEYKTYDELYDYYFPGARKVIKLPSCGDTKQEVFEFFDKHLKELSLKNGKLIFKPIKVNAFWFYKKLQKGKVPGIKDYQDFKDQYLKRLSK